MLAAGSALLAVQLSSCGDDNDSPPPQQPGTAEPTPTVTVSPSPTSSPSPFPDYELRQGDYGGENIEMKVLADGVTFKFACADGSIPTPLVPNDSGEFAAAGSYRPTSGPVPDGGYPTYPAAYRGTVYRGVVKLTVIYADSMLMEQTKSWSATYGREPNFTDVCASSPPSPSPTP
jgi:hypothetical protein